MCWAWLAHMLPCLRPLLPLFGLLSLPGDMTDTRDVSYTYDFTLTQQEIVEVCLFCPGLLSNTTLKIPEVHDLCSALGDCLRRNQSCL